MVICLLSRVLRRCPPRANPHHHDRAKSCTLVPSHGAGDIRGRTHYGPP
ncbi:hypothetical protein GA0070617_4541 [Micromonospora yangpuensis]|uniref:Uncharacterized protein n=1 Tax=Micromonospora yangpuensis TaxID=683228 RepID=A0A1C6V4E2_9ACTN|nr:hypothetical protein GA0070617_4541 [Micromonospora yangpuensis]